MCSSYGFGNSIKHSTPSGFQLLRCQDLYEIMYTRQGKRIMIACTWSNLLENIAPSDNVKNLSWLNYECNIHNKKHDYVIRMAHPMVIIILLLDKKLNGLQRLWLVNYTHHYVLEHVWTVFIFTVHATRSAMRMSSLFSTSCPSDSIHAYTAMTYLLHHVKDIIIVPTVLSSCQSTRCRRYTGNMNVAWHTCSMFVLALLRVRHTHTHSLSRLHVTKLLTFGVTLCTLGSIIYGYILYTIVFYWR